MLVACKGEPHEILIGRPALDRDASALVLKDLYPGKNFLALSDGDLSNTCPGDDEIVIGAFNGLTVVAAAEFCVDYPSQLPSKFIDAFPGQSVFLHAMHSTVDWFAFAVWKDGKLQRSLSLSPDSGVIEDIGDRLAFEAQYWSGNHPTIDEDDADGSDYPFAFHPLELGEATLAALFGYQLEGVSDRTLIEPEKIQLLRFKRKKPWWRLI